MTIVPQKPTPGPYHLAMTEAVVIDGREYQPAAVFRHGDGAFIILAGEGDNVRPIAHVLSRAGGKRSEAYKTPDPEGEATARQIAKSWLLTDIQKVLAEMGDFLETHRDTAVGFGLLCRIRGLLQNLEN